MQYLAELQWMYRATLIASVVASWAVVGIYHVRSHGLWRRSEWGRHLIGSDTVLSVILTFYICASFIPDKRIVYVVGIFLFLGYIRYRIGRSALMLKSQREGEERDAADAEALHRSIAAREAHKKEAQ